MKPKSIFHCHRGVLLVFGLAYLLSGCGLGLGGAEPCSPSLSSATEFTLAGRVRFGHVPVLYSKIGAKLNYAAQTLKPARRILVQAVDSCGSSVQETYTDDLGFFSMSVSGKEVKLQAVSRLYTPNFSLRQTGGSFQYQTQCSGEASWDIQVVDNTRSQALYTHLGSDWHSSTNLSTQLDIPLSYDASRKQYADRSAAPFAIADTLLRSLEKVCQGDPHTKFPKLMVNWSAKNSATKGDKLQGHILTSHFTVEGQVPQLYILGYENADTDEYDPHILAHEFGHYLEDSLYRADTLGGTHSLSDSLDPRVAFGEGYGNAFSAMALDDANYVDSAGLGQETAGLKMDISKAPSSASNKGIHREHSVQYLLWKLYKNNNATITQGSFSKIHEVLSKDQTSSPAFTSLLSFVSFYHARYGDSEGLKTLWEIELDQPYHALCQSPTCVGDGTDVADPFDVKKLIGPKYASDRTYGKTADPPKKEAEFWNPYRELSVGLTSGNEHEEISAGGDTTYPWNKLGYVRWYRYVHAAPSGNVTIAVENIVGMTSKNVPKTCSSGDHLDLYVFGKPGGSNRVELITGDVRLVGCPSVTFSAEGGKTYLITVNGVQKEDGALTKYDVRVTRQ